VKRVRDAVVNQTLVLTQDVETERTINQVVHQTLDLVQTVERSATYNRTIEQTLDLEQDYVANRLIDRTVEHTLNFSSVAKRVRDASAEQTLILTSMGTGNKITSRSIKQNLILEQEVSRQQVHSRTVHQVLQLGNAKKFSPLDGSYIEIPQATYILGNDHDDQLKYITLVYNNHMVSLDNPLLGDSEGSDYEIKVKRSMSNKVYTFIKRNEVKNIRYEFEMGRPKALELMEFIKASMAKQIHLRNWRNELWYGYITTNPPIFTMVSLYHNEGEKVEITLEFTGFKLN
jgi:hypothetical protein